MSKEEFAAQLEKVIEQSRDTVYKFGENPIDYFDRIVINNAIKSVMVSAIYGHIAMQAPALASFKIINGACNKINVRNDDLSKVIEEIIDLMLPPGLPI